MQGWRRLGEALHRRCLLYRTRDSEALPPSPVGSLTGTRPVQWASGAVRTVSVPLPSTWTAAGAVSRDVTVISDSRPSGGGSFGSTRSRQSVSSSRASCPGNSVPLLHVSAEAHVSAWKDSTADISRVTLHAPPWKHGNSAGTTHKLPPRGRDGEGLRDLQRCHCTPTSTRGSEGDRLVPHGPLCAPSLCNLIVNLMTSAFSP